MERLTVQECPGADGLHALGDIDRAELYAVVERLLRNTAQAFRQCDALQVQAVGGKRFRQLRQLQVEGDGLDHFVRQHHRIKVLVALAEARHGDGADLCGDHHVFGGAVMVIAQLDGAAEIVAVMPLGGVCFKIRSGKRRRKADRTDQHHRRQQYRK